MNEEEWELPEYDWPLLERVARREIAACLRELPPELRDRASRIPCLLHHWHPDVAAGDLDAVDMLGEYLAYGDEGKANDCGAIALYLGGIALYCEEEDLEFEDEARTTYLHELGHHLGWDEDEVEERGL